MCPKSMGSSDFGVGLRWHVQFFLSVLHKYAMCSDEALLWMSHGLSR